VHILGDIPEGRLCLSIGDIQVEVLSVRRDWIQRVRLTPVKSEA
jgi:Mg2+/Co2+ transporter CorB